MQPVVVDGIQEGEGGGLVDSGGPAKNNGAFDMIYLMPKIHR